MGDRVAVMNDGVLQQVDTPLNALRQARQPLRRRLHRVAVDESAPGDGQQDSCGVRIAPGAAHRRSTRGPAIGRNHGRGAAERPRHRGRGRPERHRRIRGGAGVRGVPLLHRRRHRHRGRGSHGRAQCAAKWRHRQPGPQAGGRAPVRHEVRRSPPA